MIRNKINFITGETYTLAELLSGERKIVIPDLQRDFCWGDAVHTDEKKELVTDFVNTLIDLYKWKSVSKLNLGLLYGYESPANQIQLCDGQQRITTLFLTLGMLNKFSRTNAFRQYLISDFEYKHDDREPYLNYAIRESSLYFLSDLVCHFFITDDTKYPNYYIEDIEQIAQSTNPWYYTEYDSDPSIQSMIKALTAIRNVLQTRPSEWIVSFGNFLIHRLTFMYYDMENRKNGEETFVVINTTGEPLSSTQNLKPFVMKAKINDNCKSITVDGKSVTLPQAWEIIENWFWKNRIESNGNDTADAGFTEFLRWVCIIHVLKQEDTQKEYTKKEILTKGKFKFDYEKISFEEIWQYWLAVKKVFGSTSPFTKDYLSPKEETFGERQGTRALRQIDCFKLLPIIEYCKTNNCGWENRGTVRLYQFVINLSRIENVAKNVNVLVEEVIKIANRCKDILEVLTLNVSTTILTEEEKKKLNILNEYREKETLREQIEESFWKEQEHKIWNGEILPIIKWSTDKDNHFNFNSFKEYSRIFNALFYGKMDYPDLDITRRALLAYGIENYPRKFRGSRNCSFAYEYSHWHELLFSNILLFKSFFDTMIGFTSKEDLIKQQNSIINCFPKDKDFADFVHIPQLLQYCEEKNIRYWRGTWFLIKKERWSGEHANIRAYKYYLNLRNEEKKEGWKLCFYSRDNTCVFYDKDSDKQPYIAIDMIWNAGENHDLMEIDLFLKPTNNAAIMETAQTMLKDVAESLSYNWIDGRYRLFIKMPNDDKESFILMDEHRNILFNKLSESHF